MVVTTRWLPALVGRVEAGVKALGAKIKKKVMLALEVVPHVARFRPFSCIMPHNTAAAYSLEPQSQPTSRPARPQVV
jgi:hypothetical protein